MPHDSVPKLLKVPEAVEILRTSRSTVYRLMSEGRLEFVEIGDSRRIPLDEILKFIKTNTVATKKAS